LCLPPKTAFMDVSVRLGGMENWSSDPLVVEIVREAYITGSFRTQPVAIVFRKR